MEMKIDRRLFLAAGVSGQVKLVDHYLTQQP